MYQEVYDKLSVAYLSKKNLLEKSVFKFLVAAALAGFFIGFGALIMSITTMIFKDASFPIVKLVNGFVFSLALSYVMFAGGELFTGIVLIMGFGKLTKNTSLGTVLKVFLFAYIGNFIGAIIISLLFSMTEVPADLKATIVQTAQTKTSFGFVPLMFKGIMCNILVCLAVLICNRNISDSAKLILIFWCIFPFVALGFEHSVANMTFLSLAKVLDPSITIGMIFKNLIPVTIGNIIGGLLVALTYFTIAKE